ncbi:MAG: hypothetical protein MI919_22120, partial [Holophagales bacterium]|nr:hypothetical protein [Holophagales bacterium]
PPPPPPPPPDEPEGPVTPPEPEPPEITFELLGIFGPDNRRIAALLDEQEIINALAGEVVKEKFIITRIEPEYESVEIGFVGFPPDRTSRLEIGVSGGSSRRR